MAAVADSSWYKTTTYIKDFRYCLNIVEINKILAREIFRQFILD
jgi:hypothetical protein